MDAFTIKIIQNSIHYSLHFIVPGLIAWKFYPTDWKRVWLIYIATMLIDLDHLLATPIFDPNRCSIGFHPLHSYYALVVYASIFIFSKNKWLRVLSFGLLFHFFTDCLDCVLNKLL
ncbi:MAG: DUF6122 family protein [Crocinitomicaceae bacterium]|nr:DUF6122 family protein [Crocinitomicaceae bacterium]